jgi:predicted MFS family arabinose efflux permease
LLSLTFEGALQALVPTMAGEGLEAFNGRLQAARLGGALAGPALGGILLAATSRPSVALLIDAASYLVSAAVLLSLPLSEPSRGAAGGMRALFGGIEAIRSQPQLRRLTTLAVSMAMMTPLLMLALPLIARDTGAGGIGYGLLSSAFVLGMAAGGLAAGRFSSRLGPDRTIAAGLAAAAVATSVLAWAPGYGLALVAALTLGLTVGPIDVVFFSGFQRACPPESLGRAMAQLISLISVVRAPSYVLAGIAYSALGTSTLLAFCAAVLLAGATGYLLTAASTEATPASSADRL